MGELRGRHQSDARGAIKHYGQSNDEPSFTSEDVYQVSNLV